MGTMTDEFIKFAKPRYVTRAEEEARVQEIVAALEDAGAEPSALVCVPDEHGGDRSLTLEDIAWSLYFTNFGYVGRVLPNKTKGLDEESRQKITEIRRIVGDLLDLNSTELSGFRELIEEKRASTLTKEWYTVNETAKLTKHSPYTIRQVCNLGRIEDKWKKKLRNGKWRIHRDAIAWIQNHDLPPLSPQKVSP